MGLKENISDLLLRMRCSSPAGRASPCWPRSRLQSACGGDTSTREPPLPPACVWCVAPCRGTELRPEIRNCVNILETLDKLLINFSFKPSQQVYIKAQISSPLFGDIFFLCLRILKPQNIKIYCFGSHQKNFSILGVVETTSTPTYFFPRAMFS